MMINKKKDADRLTKQLQNCLEDMYAATPQGEISQQLRKCLTASEFTTASLGSMDITTGATKAADPTGVPGGPPPPPAPGPSGPPPPSKRRRTATPSTSAGVDTEEIEEADILLRKGINPLHKGPLQCYCGVQCTSEEDYQEHKDTHPAGGAYRCSQCDTNFPSGFRACWKHFRTTHLYVHIWYCPYNDENGQACNHGKNGGRYGNDEVVNVRNHMHKKHNILTNIQCSKCESYFATKQSCRKHEVKCTGGVQKRKPFLCPHPGCKRRYTDRPGLDKHMKTHTEGEQETRHVCPVCGKDYGSTTSCNAHIRDKHPTWPEED